MPDIMTAGRFPKQPNHRSVSLPFGGVHIEKLDRGIWNLHILVNFVVNCVARIRSDSEFFDFLP